MSGAAVWLATAAVAEPLSGTYDLVKTVPSPVGTQTVPMTVKFTPCGPDCTTSSYSLGAFDLHPQGKAWTGIFANPQYTDVPCTVTLDAPPWSAPRCAQATEPPTTCPPRPTECNQAHRPARTAPEFRAIGRR